MTDQFVDITAVPVRMGLELAAPAMTEFVKDASAPTPDRVGPYPVDHAEHLSGRGGARFLIAGTGFLDGSGFAYSPDGPPAVLGEDRYQHRLDQMVEAVLADLSPTELEVVTGPDDLATLTIEVDGQPGAQRATTRARTRATGRHHGYGRH